MVVVVSWGRDVIEDQLYGNGSGNAMFTRIKRANSNMKSACGLRSSLQVDMCVGYLINKKSSR